MSYEQFNAQFGSQFLAFGKNLADTAVKAQGLTLEGFERIAELQIKTFENRVNAAVDFWSQAAEVRDLEGAKSIWPKGVQLAKESAEKLYSTGQEVLGVTVKTNEAIGELVRGQFEAANDSVTKQVNAAKKAATAK